MFALPAGFHCIEADSRIETMAPLLESSACFYRGEIRITTYNRKLNGTTEKLGQLKVDKP